MFDRINILIPCKKNFKSIDLYSGKVKFCKQSKKIDEQIRDIVIQVNNDNKVLYRIEKRQLVFFITSKCNQQCIMCPQELNIDALDNDLIIQRVIDNLDYSVIDEVCFTGGEPLLKMNLIDELIEKSPQNILITILSNGLIYPSSTIIKSNRCKLCVPIYSFNDEVHNYMTGSNSFYKVIYNLMKVSQYNIPIELRFVITKLNYKNLLEYSRFIWRNLPFVQDVAFMGIELTANAYKNKEELWINPKEYIPELLKAINYLDDNGICCWIYNLPYCFFDVTYRKFLINSISPWKIKYLPVCDYCKLRNECGGMFFSDINEFKNIIVGKSSVIV